jgi:LacI family transcriptional regulator
MAAMAVYKVLHQNGRRVPEDVQLVGFDNIEFSRRMTPELTTISQPIEEMGKLAVQMIIMEKRFRIRKKIYLMLS